MKRILAIALVAAFLAGFPGAGQHKGFRIICTRNRGPVRCYRVPTHLPQRGEGWS